MKKRPQVGQIVDAKIFPLMGRSEAFSGRITKVYTHGPIEVKGPKGDLTFVLPNEIMAIHPF